MKKKDKFDPLKLRTLAIELSKLWDEHIGKGFETKLSKKNYKTHTFINEAAEGYSCCNKCGMRYFIRDGKKYVINNDSCNQYVLRETLS